MELETINRLYLELSQFATAKTSREIELEDLLRSAHCIAERRGEDVAWERFAASIGERGIGSVTARTYRVLEDDERPIPTQPHADAGAIREGQGACEAAKRQERATGKGVRG